MDRPDQTTHFGFRDVPLGDKQTLVNDVFHSVAQRYDLMNDLMSVRPAPGLERPDDQRAQSAARRGAVCAARRRRRHRRHRVPRRQGGGRGLSGHRLRHQFRHARRRPHARGGTASRRPGIVRRRQCRGAGVSGPQFRRLHHRVRHPQRAADRSGAGRSVSRAEARRPISVPGILHRRRAGPRSDLRSVFVQGDSAARPRGDRRRRILSLPRRIDPQISQARTRLPR